MGDPWPHLEVKRSTSAYAQRRAGRKPAILHNRVTDETALFRIALIGLGLFLDRTCGMFFDVRPILILRPKIPTLVIASKKYANYVYVQDVFSEASEPRGPGGQLTPTFSGAGSTYGAWPLTFCPVFPWADLSTLSTTHALVGWCSDAVLQWLESKFWLNP